MKVFESDLETFLSVRPFNYPQMNFLFKNALDLIEINGKLFVLKNKNKLSHGCNNFLLTTITSEKLALKRLMILLKMLPFT